jgi:predicted nucleic acid-binding protein
MLIVSDTGPIRYLAIIGHVDKLPLLYGAVAIPDGVARELSHPNTPEPARAFIAAPPAWVTVHAVSGVDPGLDVLGPGERQAIWLAAQIHADLLLCDDLMARRIAAERHLQVIGTLGVLRDAAKRGLLEIGAALDPLRTRTNFRATDDLYNEVLKKAQGDDPHVAHAAGLEAPIPNRDRIRPDDYCWGSLRSPGEIVAAGGPGGLAGDGLAERG